MRSPNEETIYQLTKHRDSIILDSSVDVDLIKALDHAIKVINNPLPRQIPLQSGWQEDGR